jgi:hypothetical protein
MSTSVVGLLLSRSPAQGSGQWLGGKAAAFVLRSVPSCWYCCRLSSVRLPICNDNAKLSLTTHNSRTSTLTLPLLFSDTHTIHTHSTYIIRLGCRVWE